MLSLPRRLLCFAALSCSLLASCDSTGFSKDPTSPWAPSIDPRGEAVDPLIVGHRLMAAQEYELALDSFLRAAGEYGLTGEILTSLGSANLGLGRLQQAESLLRQAVKKEPDWPESWNNLGVVLTELNKTGEAVEVFKRAFALDNGESVAIRDNLRLALAKLDNIDYGFEQEQEFKLVQRGSGTYLVTPN